MSVSYNRVCLVGYIGRDPQISETSGGRFRANFSLATHRFEVSSGGEQRQRTDWHQIVAWGKLAERCKVMLGKSKLVLIAGRLETRTWEGEDGRQHTRVYVTARDLVVFGGRPDTPDHGDMNEKAVTAAET